MFPVVNDGIGLHRIYLLPLSGGHYHRRYVQYTTNYLHRRHCAVTRNQIYCRSSCTWTQFGRRVKVAVHHGCVDVINVPGWNIYLPIAIGRIAQREVVNRHHLQSVMSLFMLLHYKAKSLVSSTELLHNPVSKNPVSLGLFVKNSVLDSGQSE